MKSIIALCVIVLLVSCKNESGTNTLLTTDSLPAQQFTLNTEKDTTLQTSNGALLKIPAGAIASDNGTVATIEIKEAYSLLQMIKSGLTTQANGEPLSSGGMIYINAAAGQKLTIKKAIKVAIPSQYLANGMQLYKGDTSQPGKINWTKPQPLPANPQLAAINNGRQMFQAMCNNCHAIDKDMTGPALAHFEKRIPYSESNKPIWFHSFIIPYQTDEDTTRGYFTPNVYWCNLISRFGVTGTPFPQLKYEDWKAIYDYVQTVSDSLQLPMPWQAELKKSADSCEVYNKASKELNAKKKQTLNERNNLISDNGKMVIDTNYTNQLPGPGPSLDFDRMVSPDSFSAEYYQFSIETFGWFNLDILFKDIQGMEPSQLMVRVQGAYRERLNMYLIIPSIKANIPGGRTEAGKDEYAFYTTDGKIPLPQGAKAYILGLSESSETIAYSLTIFTISKSQELNIELQKATKEEFAKAMSVLNAADIQIKVQDAKNAGKIRMQDVELQKIEQGFEKLDVIKPKGCDCSCEQASNLQPADTTVRK